MPDPSSRDVPQQDVLAAAPFTLGVASGDPLPDGVVIWTRLAQNPLDSFGGMAATDVPVEWQVAEDAAFTNIVRSGTATARPEYVHAVHVDVRGLLPGRQYFYRFRTGTTLSPVGRTKTAPDPAANPSQLRFGKVSDAAWFDGYYTAYRHLAEEDLDVVFCLGDYVYEYGVKTNGGRPGYPALPEKYDRVRTFLSDCRDWFALYKLDPDLQAAHAAFPWIVTWDDHEVINNYAGLNHPIAPPADFRVRRANAYRAYWEHMPLRLLQPVGPNLQLYRRFTFGRLAEFNVLDTRQYRSDQACGDGLRTNCAERLDPARTMLGSQQESWLFNGLSASQARWNVLAQQIMFSQLDFSTDAGQQFSMDLWDGYKPARDRIIAAFTSRHVSNPLIFSGDIHRNMAAEVKANFNDSASATVATEYVGTSISSGMDGADRDQYAAPFLAANRHVKFYNSQRGYLRCTLTAAQLTTDFRIVPYVRTQGAPVQTRATFVTENGHPGLHQVANNPPVGVPYSEDVLPPGPLRFRPGGEPRSAPPAPPATS